MTGPPVHRVVLPEMEAGAALGSLYRSRPVVVLPPGLDDAEADAREALLLAHLTDQTESA